MSAKRKKPHKKQPVPVIGKGGQPMTMPSSSPTGQQPSILTPPDVSQAISNLETKLGSNLITYYLHDGAQIGDDAMVPMYKQLRALGKQKRLNLFIQSRGGATESPWKLIELFRNYCEYFAVLIPYRAHSAATHIALGANEIIMTSFSELGPVDPYRTHPLLPVDADGKSVSISVQDLKHCISFIKRETDTPYTPEALAQLFSSMFDKIHPLAMGAIEQSYALSQLISEKALATHMDPEKEKEKIAQIASKLLDDYKSHTFQIGRIEARKLGLPVVDADNQTEDLLWNLYEIYSQLEPIDPTPIPGSTKKRQKMVGHIDSLSKRFVHVGIYSEDQPGALKVIGGTWEER